MTDQTQVSNPPVELNPALDRKAIRARFDATGRAHIKDVLIDDAAQRFHTCLSTELPWRLAYNDGDKSLQLTRDEISRMSPQDLKQLEMGVFERATRQFQYAYSDYPAAQTLNDPAEPNFYVHDVLRYLNSKPFMDFLRDVTGVEGKLFADGHATCFQSGHFLTIHNDSDTQERRVIAYVFNMTSFWRPDWGAALEFFDDEYNIVESFAPRFNALNIFQVPQAHAVSFVAPFAAGRRFGMTGWFHRAD